MSRKSVTLSCVITFHRERLWAHTSLLSIERCRQYSEQRGMRVDFVAVLDKPDSETRRIVTKHPAIRRTDRVIQVDLGCPSAARNAGVRKTSGDFVAMLDGDDYFSENWLFEAVEFVRRRRSCFIAHPEILITFGRERYYFWQPDQLGTDFLPAALLAMNYWNLCSVAARQVYEEVPFQPVGRGEQGFAYEDWQWNCDTIAQNYVHRTVPQTVRFERRKESGSMTQVHHAASTLIRHGRYFEQRTRFRREKRNMLE